MSLRITVNQVELKVDEGQNLLEACLQNGFDIPHLCYHPTVESIGACRLCLVELEQRGRTEITTSCNTRVEEGMRVVTDSPQLRQQRAMNMELLLSRAPGSSRLRALAASLGLEATRFAPIPSDGIPNCILCELCVRVCASLGHNALCAVGRGEKKRVGLPLNQPAESCVGCSSCASVCPTGCIVVKDTAEERAIWGQKFKLLRCAQCGAVLLTEKQRQFALQKGSLKEDDDVLCGNCKQINTVKRFSNVVW